MNDRYALRLSLFVLSKALELRSLTKSRSPSIFISPLGKFVIVLTPYACNAIALKSLKNGTLDVVVLKGTTLTAKVLKPECVTVPIVGVPPPPVIVTVGVEVYSLPGFVTVIAEIWLLPLMDATAVAP